MMFDFELFFLILVLVMFGIPAIAISLLAFLSIIERLTDRLRK